MSKNSPNRVSDKEFRELIPSLPIEELFIIEIRDGERWIKFWEYNGKVLTCNVCKSKVTLPVYKHHCNYANHKDNLAKIKQFYHPRRTFSKPNLPHWSEEQIKKLEDMAAQNMKSISGIVDNGLQKQYVRHLRSLCLTEPVKSPSLVFVEAAMPLDQLVKLQYQTKSGEWQKMLTAEAMHENSRFLCALCSRWCGGIITVKAHFGGTHHMTQQLALKGVRHKTYRFLTKYCRFSYNPKFIITVNDRAKHHYKKKMDNWLLDFKKGNVADETVNSDVEASDHEVEKTTPDSRPKDKNLTSAENKATALAKSILNRIDKVEPAAADDEGLIGVEYVTKLLKPAKPENSYECVLCEFLFNENKMQAHLTSYDHRSKYCDKHYSATMKKYKDTVGHMKYSDFVLVMSPLLAKLAKSIEQVHSRAIPSAIDDDEFMSKRSEYVATIYAYRHACQEHGPSFSRTVTEEEIELFKQNKHNYSVPVVTTKHNCRFTIKPNEPYLGVSYFSQEDRLTRGLSLKTSKGEVKSRKRSPTPPVSRPSVEKRGQKRERQKEEKTTPRKSTNIWATFDKGVKAERTRIQREYTTYRNEPETHPLYETEWNRFWKQRKDELIAEGIDHRTYNYQAEWVHYFKNRLEELFCEAVRQAKDVVRTRLNIPKDVNEGDNFNVGRVSTKVVGPPSKSPRYSQGGFEFQEERAPPLQQQQQQRQAPLHQAIPAPFQQIVMSNMVNPIIATPQPVPQPVEKQYAPPSRDDRPNVIHVLRLMTAMEDNLGSLGSKIMDLFSKALQLEKKCANNPALLEKCILTPENCNLLEVSMEKLKGTLFAGLLEGNKAQSFNKVIKSTEELLTYADSRGWRENGPDNSVEENNAVTHNNELQKLINVIQNRNSTPSLQQKSLSDTLKALMSGKPKDRGDSQVEQSNHNEERFGGSSFNYGNMERMNARPNNNNMEDNRQMQRPSDFNYNNLANSNSNGNLSNFRGGPTQGNNLKETNASDQISHLSAAELRLGNFNRFNSSTNVPFANFDTTLSTSQYRGGNSTIQNSYAGSAKPSSFGSVSKNIHQNPTHMLRPQYNEGSFGGRNMNRSK